MLHEVVDGAIVVAVGSGRYEFNASPLELARGRWRFAHRTSTAEL